MVLNQPVYTKYDIAVTTANAVGQSEAATEFVFGYSGEGNPKQVVNGFRLQKKNGVPMVYSDNATFVWNKVEESDVESQGFFRGYMVSRCWLSLPASFLHPDLVTTCMYACMHACMQ